MPMEADQQDAILWYRVADLPPPYNAHVWLQWAGRQFKGYRRAGRRGDGWSEVLTGGAERGVGIGDGDPVLWRPQFADKWQLPLPRPVEQPRGGMHSIAQRFTAVEAAEAAAEMEADREAAKRRGNDPLADPFGRWWRIGFDVKYDEPRGGISRKMVEGRVMRAMAHCEYWYVHGMSGFASGGAEAKLVEAATAAELRRMAEAEASGVDTPWRVPFRPLPQDQQDFATAMAWVVALNPPERWSRSREPWSFSRDQRVMLWRAQDNRLSWTEIGYYLVGERRIKAGAPPVPAKECRAIYEAAIDACHEVANGRRKPRVDHIAALQERNRRARLA